MGKEDLSRIGVSAGRRLDDESSVATYCEEIKDKGSLTREELENNFLKIEKGRAAYLLLKIYCPSSPAVKIKFEAVLPRESAQAFLEETGFASSISCTEDEKKKMSRNIKKKRTEDEEDSVLDNTLYILANNTRKFLPKDREFLESCVSVGVEAKKDIIEHNLKWAVKLARGFMGRKVSMGDLIQDANEGLLIAAAKFDRRKGCNFDTYATSWVINRILEATRNARPIKLTHGRIRKITKYFEVKSQLEMEFQQEPEINEIAKAMGIRNEEVEEIIRIMAQEENISSLDAPVLDSGGESTLADFIRDPSVFLEAGAVDHEYYEQFGRFLCMHLSPDRLKGNEPIITRVEARVLLLLGGYDNHYVSRTLEEVGEITGLTRERIRQIRKKAAGKILSSGAAKYLFEGEELEARKKQVREYRARMEQGMRKRAERVRENNRHRRQKGQFEEVVLIGEKLPA